MFMRQIQLILTPLVDSTLGTLDGESVGERVGSGGSSDSEGELDGGLVVGLSVVSGSVGAFDGP